MKPNLFLIIQFFILMFFAHNASAQYGITAINTVSTDLPNSDTIFNRKGAGVRSGAQDLSNRWDSTGTDFKLLYNYGTDNIVSINGINIEGLGNANRIAHTALVKVKRIVNPTVNHGGNHLPYYVLSKESPSAVDNAGTFLLGGPEVVSMETALVSNNINTGYDNIFQNSNQNVHYSNIERIDYVIPNAITTSASDDLNSIGFTIYDRGKGDNFEIAGIKRIDANQNPSAYISGLKSILASDFGDNLLESNADYTIFQKDLNFNNSECRPSVTVNENISGVFISFASLGFTPGQTIYGFSLFDSDIGNANIRDGYLLDYNFFPNNTNSSDMLDLVNSIGVYSTNITVLSSSTILTASLQNEKVLLQWNIASLADAQKIYVQKASSNLVYSDFEEINRNQSSFIDVTARGDIAYYRLKIITTNGLTKYSNTQIIRSKFSDIQIFPTVANDKVYVTSKIILVNKPLTISIFNVDGKLIQTETRPASKSMDIDVDNLQGGMYIISVVQNNEVLIRQKIIKY